MFKNIFGTGTAAIRQLIALARKDPHLAQNGSANQVLNAPLVHDGDDWDQCPALGCERVLHSQRPAPELLSLQQPHRRQHLEFPTEDACGNVFRADPC